MQTGLTLIRPSWRRISTQTGRLRAPRGSVLQPVDRLRVATGRHQLGFDVTNRPPLRGAGHGGCQCENRIVESFIVRSLRSCETPPAVSVTATAYTAGETDGGSSSPGIAGGDAVALPSPVIGRKRGDSCRSWTRQIVAPREAAPGKLLTSRGIFRELALQGSSMDAECARCLRYVAPAVSDDALHVFPLDASERRR
jgi:hypothetical protein